MDLEEVKQLINAKNFEKALKLLNKYIEEDPLNENLQFEKASVLFQLEEFKEAFKIINSVTKFGSPSAYWIIKAKTCEQLSQFQAAFDCYDELIGIQPKSEYAFGQGNMKFKLNEFQEALTCYNRALSFDQHNLEFLKAKYEVLKKLSKRDECKILKNVIRFLEINYSKKNNHKILLELKNVNKQIRNDPKNLKFFSEKIFLLIRLGRLQSAINIMEKLEHENPSEKEFLELKKILLRKIKNMQSHLDTISKDLENDTENISLVNQKVTLFADLEKYDDLRLFLKEILKNKQDSVVFLQKVLKKFEIAKNYEAQLTLFEQLIKLEPNSEKILKQQIYALNELDRFDEALTVIQKALEKIPKDETLLRMKLYTLQCMGSKKEILEIVEKLLEINPNDEKLIRVKISTLNKFKQFTESMSIVNNLLEKDLDNMFLIHSKIFILKKLGKYSEALDIIEQVLEKTPRNEKLLQAKVLTLNSLGKYSEALEVIDGILQNDPENKEYISRKIYALSKLGRISESFVFAEKQLERTPDDEVLLRHKISFLIELGRFDDALTIIEELAKQHPNDYKLKKTKMFTLNKLNRFEEYLETVEELLVSSPNDVSLMGNKAYGLSRLSKYSESTNLLECLFDQYPNDSFRFTPLFARILHSELPKGDNHAFVDSKILKNVNNSVWISVKCKLYFLERKYLEARKVIEENEQLVESLEFQKDLAFCYESTYERDKALSLYTSILEKNPDDEFSLFGRCQTYIKKRKYDLAMKDIRRAYSINHLTKYKHTIVFILGITGKYDEAMDVLKTFTATNQDSKSILKLKGAIHRKNKQFESSLDCYEQLLAKNPNDIDGLMGTALVHEDTRQYDLAIKQVDKILEREGFLLAAMKLKVSILTKIGNFVEARNNLNTIIQKTSDSHTISQNEQSYDSVQEVLKSIFDEQWGSRFSSMEDMITKPKAETEELEDLFNSDLNTILKQRESDILEFKSTLRYDTKMKQINKGLELEALKTICGFLNSQGGCLIVGYSDDEKICWGLTEDYKSLGKRKDWDGWQQYLESQIKTRIGTVFSGFVSMRQVVYEENDHKFEIAKIMVKKSRRAAYVKDNNSNIFYARRNGQTDSLDAKESNEWIKDHNLE